MNPLVMRLIAFVVTALAGWLMDNIPGLSIEHASAVAKLLVDHWWTAAMMLLALGAVLFKRPGDVAAKDLEGARVFNKPEVK